MKRINFSNFSKSDVSSLTLLIALPGGLLLLHPRVFGHVDGGVRDAVGVDDGVVTGMVGRGADGAPGPGRVLEAGGVAGRELGQRGHELGHGGLAVDEARLGGGARRVHGRVVRATRPPGHRGQPEATPSVVRQDGCRRPRLHARNLLARVDQRLELLLLPPPMLLSR